MQRITQTQLTNMQMNLNLNATMTKALVGMVKEYATEVTTELSKVYGFSLEDALKRFDLENLQPNEKKKGVKSEKKRTVKSEKKEPLFLLPYCGVTCEEWCKAVKYNSGLMTQCTKSPESNEAYCKTCAKTVDASSGKPKFGSMHDRDKEGWTDPSGKSPVRYATVMSKIKYEGVPVTEEQVNAEVAKMGWTMPPEEWTQEDTTDKQKHRGRPKKSKPMTSGTVGDDMIANLVSQANLQQEADSSQETVSASDQEEEEPESDKKEKEAKKDAGKKEKEAKKEADKKEKEAKKEADKKAKPEAKKENSDKKKSKEVALKEATTIAESLAKKTAETNVEKQLLKEEGELSEEEEEEISVTKFVFQGENYLKDEKNVIYDYESQSEIGIWNGSAIELYDP